MNRVVVCVVAWALSAGFGAAQSSGLTPSEQKEGFRSLFDGKTLAGWTAHILPPERVYAGNRPGIGRWAVENGVLVSVPQTGTGKLVTDESFGDFILRLEFMNSPGANSGIFVRSPETGDITEHNSIEANVSDIHEEWPTGSVNSIQRSSQAGAPQTDGKWNSYEITVRGNHIIVVLNGQKTVDVRADRLARGKIALQYPRNPPTAQIKFRNIRIKTL